MPATIKAGTRIELFGTPSLGVPSEMAKIGRWNTKIHGPIPNHVTRTNAGWHVVRFSDGGSMVIHQTRFRIIDNRQ